VDTEITENQKMAMLPLTCFHRVAPAAGKAAPEPEFRPLHYETLLGATAWERLPIAVRERFANHEARWTGTMTLHASFCGRCVARLCKLVGEPLPPACREPVRATVHVEPDCATRGSRWIRRYELPHRAIEIRSVKSIDADGRMVERLPMGLRMELDLRTDDGALHFVTTGYHLEIPRPPLFRRLFRRPLRIRFPAWWLPGPTHVVHRDLGDGRFRFTMTIRHRWLGELFHHDGVFTSGTTGG
jgi:hypothetical protein